MKSDTGIVEVFKIKEQLFSVVYLYMYNGKLVEHNDVTVEADENDYYMKRWYSKDPKEDQTLAHLYSVTVYPRDKVREIECFVYPARLNSLTPITVD